MLLQGRPCFVVGERLSGDQCDPIVRCGDLGEVDGQILILQMGERERRAAQDEIEIGRAVGKQAFAVRQQEIERTVRADGRRECIDFCLQLFAGRRAGWKTMTQRLQQMTKRAFAVGLADRQVAAVEYGRVIGEIAVMRKDPVTSPQFAYEGVGVLQSDRSLRRLANVRDGIERMNRKTADQLGDRRIERRARIEENAGPFAFEKGDTPSVAVDVGAAAPCLESGEGKAQVGWRVAVHAEQLAHFSALSVIACLL